MKTYLGNFDSWKDVVNQFTGSTYVESSIYMVYLMKNSSTS